MNEIAIRTVGLTKSYGHRRGVIGLNFEVEHGKIFGFVGPNGAGKTTTIRLLMDLMRPTHGRAELLGKDAHTKSHRLHQEIGYVPGETSLYERMTATDLLDFFARLRGGVDRHFRDELCQRLRLHTNDEISTMSKGNRQKIALVQALMHRPSVLILDEPTSGLDPLMQREVHTLIRAAANAGAAVLLSSHVLSEIEQTADAVGIVRDGQMVLAESVAKLRNHAPRRVTIKFANTIESNTFAHLTGVSDLSIDDNALSCAIRGSMDPLIKAAARYEIVDLTAEQPDLETIFLDYYRDRSSDAG